MVEALRGGGSREDEIATVLRNMVANRSAAARSAGEEACADHSDVFWVQRQLQLRVLQDGAADTEMLFEGVEELPAAARRRLEENLIAFAARHAHRA